MFIAPNAVKNNSPRLDLPQAEPWRKTKIVARSINIEFLTELFASYLRSSSHDQICNLLV